MNCVLDDILEGVLSFLLKRHHQWCVGGGQFSTAYLFFIIRLCPCPTNASLFVYYKECSLVTKQYLVSCNGDDVYLLPFFLSFCFSRHCLLMQSVDFSVLFGHLILSSLVTIPMAWGASCIE